MPRSVAAQTAPKVVRIGWLTSQQASSLTLFLVKQGYGVRDARDESAQAGEQQQFFDLPDHDVLPREGPGDSNNDEGELWVPRADSHQKRNWPEAVEVTSPVLRRRQQRLLQCVGTERSGA
jgi:hypothetical protein